MHRERDPCKPSQMQMGGMGMGMTMGISHLNGNHSFRGLGSHNLHGDIEVSENKRARRGERDRECDLVEDDKTARSRERNRMHARKTRERKKRQMETLIQTLDELRHEHKRLVSAVNDRFTARILLRLSGNAEAEVDQPEAHSFPAHLHFDSLQQESSLLNERFEALSDGSDIAVEDITPDEFSHGFDVSLLHKQRQDCTADELEAIRRERNRIHARRTRERKRHQLERTTNAVEQLEEKNKRLRSYIQHLGILNVQSRSKKSEIHKGQRLEQDNGPRHSSNGSDSDISTNSSSGNASRWSGDSAESRKDSAICSGERNEELPPKSGVQRYRNGDACCQKGHVHQHDIVLNGASLERHTSEAMSVVDSSSGSASSNGHTSSSSMSSLSSGRNRMYGSSSDNNHDKGTKGKCCGNGHSGSSDDGGSNDARMNVYGTSDDGSNDAGSPDLHDDDAGGAADEL